MSYTAPTSFPPNYSQPEKEIPQIVDYTPPDEIYAEIIKHQNRIKNLEKTIEQSQEKARKLSVECMNIMGAAEVITFDLFLLDFIFDARQFDAHQYDSRQFDSRQFDSRQFDARQFSIPTPLLTFAKECDYVAQRTKVEELASHINYVYQSMDTAISHIFRSDFDRPSASSISILQKSITPREFQAGEEIIEPSLYADLPKDLPQQEESTIAVPPEFEQRLKTLLEAEELSEEICKIRGIIGAISHKLSDIDSIRAQIKALKPKIADPNSFSIQDCPPESILNSPFYKAVEQRYHFLNLISKSLRDQTSMIKRVDEELAKAQERFKSIKAAGSKVFEKYSAVKKNLIRESGELQNQILDLQEKYHPYTEAIFPKDPAARFDSMQQDNIAEWDEIDKLLKDKIAQTEKDSNDYIELSSAYEMFEQLRDMRTEIFEACKVSSESSRKWFYSQQANFSAIADVTKSGMQIDEFQNQTRDLKKLENLYIRFIETFRTSNIEKFCQNVSNCARQLQDEIAASQLREEIEEQTSGEPIDYEKKYNDLCAEEAAIDEELMQIEEQIRHTEEERFILAKQKDVYKDFFITKLNFMEERVYEKVKKILTCQHCKNNQRNLYFPDCHHAICSECFQKAGGENCPICGHPVKEKYPLYFQK